MIERHKLVAQWNSRPLQLSDRSGKVLWAHVACGVIVESHHHDPRMAATGSENEEVQIAKIVAIASQEDKALVNGMREVARIALPIQANLHRSHNAVTSLFEQSTQALVRQVIIQINVHGAG
jgi:hypothetical protein